MALEQEIIELVRLSATKSVGDMGFSSPWISIGSGGLIRIKYVSKSAEYLGQLFISIFAPMGFDYEWVEEVGLLAVKLVLGLVVGASSQLESLSTGTILGPGIDKTVQAGWIVLEGDLRDERPRWWSRLEHCGAFGG